MLKTMTCTHQTSPDIYDETSPTYLKIKQMPPPPTHTHKAKHQIHVCYIMHNDTKE